LELGVIGMYKMFWEESKKELGKHFELLATGFDTEETIIEKCNKVKKYNMRSFMVVPNWLPVLAREFKGTDIKVGAGVGFPIGAETPKAKGIITEEAIRLGATSIDMSLNLHALKAGHIKQVEEELRICREVARDIEIKSIIEVPFLTEYETKLACELLDKYEYDWVKSATGQYLPPTMEQVALIMECLKDSKVRVKVSGVKAPRAQNAYAFMMAGVEIIGSQNCDEIIDGLEILQKLGVFPSK
jgi:deoxyribose-phosphate aldolase